MYEDYYGFKELPFNVTPDPRFLYRSSSHRDALAYIAYGVFQRKGFIVIIGEVGVGKTTVVNAFIDLFQPSLEVAFVFSTKFPFEQLLYLICKDFGLAVDGMNKAQMLLTLSDFLVNLETWDKKLLQIMLIGQPELEAILNMEDLRQLKQRIPGVCRISILSRDELVSYVNYRLEVVSSMNGGPQFTEDSFNEIYHYSGGIPRLINLLCDRVLLIGFVANTRIIDGRIVREGIRDIETPDITLHRRFKR